MLLLKCHEARMAFYRTALCKIANVNVPVNKLIKWGGGYRSAKWKKKHGEEKESDSMAQNEIDEFLQLRPNED